MNGFGFLLVDGIVYTGLLSLLIYLRLGSLTFNNFLAHLHVFGPLFLLVTFILWVFSFYDVKQLRKSTVSYKFLAICLLLSLVGAASIIYFGTSFIRIITPKAVLFSLLFLYYAYIYQFRKSYFRWSVSKLNVCVFGKSPTLTELVALMKKSNGFKIRELEESPSPDKNYSLRNLDLVIIGSKLFATNPTAWETISNKFIAKGACVDTDFNAFERVFRRVSREAIEDQIWLLRGIANRRDSAMYAMLKRTLDTVLSVAMLPVLVPLGCLIWVAIKLIDGCDPIYKQPRVGHLGKKIVVYKFRTINPKNQESSKETTTRTGKLLRRFRLDEIPQIINVLKGEISLVGPRPLWSEDYNFLNKHLPNHELRTIAKPGITGWAQLNFKAPPAYCNFKNDAPETLDAHAFDAAFTRFSYDVWYIKNRSIWLDFEIIVKTGIRMFIKDSHIA